MGAEMCAALKDFAGPLVALVGITSVMIQYWLTTNRHLKQDKQTAKREFERPVREAQLKLFQEATSAAARIATLDRSSPKWDGRPGGVPAPLLRAVGDGGGPRRRR